MSAYRENLKRILFVLICALGLAFAFTPFGVRQITDEVRSAGVKDPKPEDNRAGISLASEVESESFSSTEQVGSEENTIETSDPQNRDDQDYDSIYEPPEFYTGLKAVNPRSAFLLTHYAEMQPALVTVDESRDYLNSEGYGFLSAMIVICDRCALGYMFYEKYALGRQMTPDEYVQFAKSPEFESSIEAALSTDEFQRAYTDLKTETRNIASEYRR